MPPRSKHHSLPPCATEVSELLRRFASDLNRGLSHEEARKKVLEYGPNTFGERKRSGIMFTVARQFKSPLVLILSIAAIVTLVLKEFLDTGVIAAALGINVCIGAFIEERASRAFDRLIASQQKTGTLIRDGVKKVLPAGDIVPGDIVLLEAGATVPGDMRLAEANSLSINEAILTGEWAPVFKDTPSLPPPSGGLLTQTPIAEQTNMAWMGTQVTEGSGKGIVVATGTKTQAGMIAQSLTAITAHLTPVQLGIRSLTRFLSLVVILAVFVIFILGIARGEHALAMALLAIAVAVAMMPEGLLPAVTVTLALGMEAILKKGGLVRNVLAAETLGSTSIILVDKTGTLTEGRMHVEELLTAASLEGALKEAASDTRTLFSLAVLSSDAFLEETTGGQEELIVRGRPIEQAIVLAGVEAGLTQDLLCKDFPRIDFLPFVSSRRFSVSLHENNEDRGHKRLIITGAPEVLLSLSTNVYRNGEPRSMSVRERSLFEETQAKKASRGVRLIAVAFRDVVHEHIPTAFRTFVFQADNAQEAVADGVLGELTFAGFIALSDPIREEARAAVTGAREAGVRSIMLTGDNPGTALAIAQKVGIATAHDGAVTGNAVATMNDDELTEALSRNAVFARVLPEQKLRIVHVLKGHGDIVAMTGDGVNDAPALLAADIGIAVGSGTDVAKEASDLVLLDNSFSVIIHAIEEGRRIMDNLKKIVAALLSTSFSEVFIIAAAFALGGPIPVLPTQILWTNIIGEGFLSFAFAFEPAEEGLMRRPPVRNGARNLIISRDIKILIALISLSTGVFLVIVYALLLSFGVPLEKLRTIMFASLALDSIFFSFSIKNLKRPLWSVAFLSNTYLIGALAVSIALLFSALTLPPLQRILSLSELSIVEFLFLLGIGIFNLITIEIAKYYVFRRRAYKERVNAIS